MPQQSRRQVTSKQSCLITHHLKEPSLFLLLTGPTVCVSLCRWSQRVASAAFSKRGATTFTAKSEAEYRRERKSFARMFASRATSIRLCPSHMLFSRLLLLFYRFSLFSPREFRVHVFCVDSLNACLWIVTGTLSEGQDNNEKRRE